MLNMLATLAQYERELIIERANAGIAVGRESGTRFGPQTGVTLPACAVTFHPSMQISSMLLSFPSGSRMQVVPHAMATYLDALPLITAREHHPNVTIWPVLRSRAAAHSCANRATIGQPAYQIRRFQSQAERQGLRQ